MMRGKKGMFVSILLVAVVAIVVNLLLVAKQGNDENGEKKTSIVNDGVYEAKTKTTPVGPQLDSAKKK